MSTSTKKRTIAPDLAAENAELHKIFLAKKKALKLTQQKIADEMEVTPPSIFAYLNGQIPLNIRAATTFARVLNVPVSAFSRRLAREIDEIASSQAAWVGDNNAASTYLVRSFNYPLLGWDQVAGSLEAVQKFHAGAVELASHSSETDAGRRAYWLTVRREMMNAPSGMSFPEGMLILVSPDITPNDGQFVIARRKGSTDGTFRQLRLDGGEQFLRRLNPAYPTDPVEDRWEIIGTVVGAQYPGILFQT